jgi:hypothetical protein
MTSPALAERVAIPSYFYHPPRHPSISLIGLDLN